jgi:hypothetical protein
MATNAKSKSLLKVGNNVFIRTVTHYFTGKIVEVEATEVTLSDASWIADTGRYQQFLEKGSVNEVEPIPDGMVTIGRGSIIDVSNWAIAFPRIQK